MEAVAHDAMKPWEQHHAVISMPRFAYNPTFVLKHNAGFLITCSFRREKSATKEILALIQEYTNLVEDASQGHSGTNDTKTGTMDKRPVDVEGALPQIQSIQGSEGVKNVRGSFLESSTGPKVEGNDAGEDLAATRLSTASSSHEDGLNVRGNEFTLVKLTTMGVIYICTSLQSPGTVLGIVCRILKDVQTGTRAAPRWCHRIVPVQATCSIQRDELQRVVTHLVKAHLHDHVPSSEHPISYAVAFNRRGVDVAKSCSTASFKTTVLSRDECIVVVTSAVQQVATTARVDLTTPQMVVNVELIPVAGPQSCLMCAVSILPGDLIVSKPKIQVKPLAPLSPKPKKRKHSN